MSDAIPNRQLDVSELTALHRVDDKTPHFMSIGTPRPIRESWVRNERDASPVRGPHWEVVEYLVLGQPPPIRAVDIRYYQLVPIFLLVLVLIILLVIGACVSCAKVCTRGIYDARTVWRYVEIRHGLGQTADRIGRREYVSVRVIDIPQREAIFTDSIYIRNGRE